MTDPVDDHRMGHPGHDVGVGHHQAGGHHEARSFLDDAASGPHDLDRRPLRFQHGRAHGHVGGQGHERSRLRRQAGEDDGEALGVEERLDPGEHRRHRRQHVVHACRMCDLSTAASRECEPAVGQEATHQPGRHQRGHHGHGHPGGGVDRTQADPAQRTGRAGPQEAPHAAEDEGGPEDDDQGDDAAGVFSLGQTHQGRGHQGAQEQSEPETTERQHLRRGAESQSVQARHRHHHQQQVVDPVHRRRSFLTWTGRRAKIGQPGGRCAAAAHSDRKHAHVRRRTR